MTEDWLDVLKISSPFLVVVIGWVVNEFSKRTLGAI